MLAYLRHAKKWLGHPQGSLSCRSLWDHSRRRASTMQRVNEAWLGPRLETRCLRESETPDEELYGVEACWEAFLQPFEATPRERLETGSETAHGQLVNAEPRPWRTMLNAAWLGVAWRLVASFR